MIDYFAGKYFVQEGLMTARKLEEIMARQSVLHKNFRTLETEPGSFLEENQIMLIKLLQHSIDEKLGDLAFEYDGSDGEHFKSVVRKQDILNTAFFDQLIVEGIITPDKVAPLLEKLRTYYALNVPGISRNLKHDFDIIIGRLINTGESNANEYINIAIKYILRFIGANIKFGETHSEVNYFARRAVIQKIVTDPRRYFLGLCGEKEVLQNISELLEHSFPPSQQFFGNVRYRSLSSFLDCISNVFQCQLMTEKNVLLVDRASVFKFVTITAENKIFSLPVTVMDMPFEIITGFGDKPNFAVISHNL